MDDIIRFLFWNVHKKKENVELLLQYGIQNDIQLIAVLEAPTGEEIEDSSGYYRRIPKIDTSKAAGIEVFIHIDSSMPASYFREKQRFALLRLDEWNLNLIVAHLNSKREESGEEAREVDLETMRADIKSIEEARKSKHTLIMGDLNTGLFEEMMYRVSGLNARLFQYQMTKETQRLHEVDRDLFYNPMLVVYENDVNGETAIKGTHYYEGHKQNWLCYDHVLMKHEVMPRFDIKRLAILNSLGNTQLISNHKTIQSISDHLPVYFEIMNERG